MAANGHESFTGKTPLDADLDLARKAVMGARKVHPVGHDDVLKDVYTILAYLLRKKYNG